MDLGLGGSRAQGALAPLSRDLFSPALSLALLRMRARMSARVAARKYVGGDPTNAYLYCVYTLVCGAINIRVCTSVPFHKSVCAND